MGPAAARMTCVRWFFVVGFLSASHRHTDARVCQSASQGKKRKEKAVAQVRPGEMLVLVWGEEKEKERQKAVGFDGVPFLFQRVYIRNTQKYAPHRCFLQEIRSTRRRRGPSFDLQNEQRTHKNNPNENPGEGPTESWLYVAWGADTQTLVQRHKLLHIHEPLKRTKPRTLTHRHAQT